MVNGHRQSHRHAGLAIPSMLIASAEIKARLGETAAALTVADDAIEQIGRNGEFSSESDAYRVKGEQLLMQGAPDTAGAKRCFAKALDVARAQQAKSLELRATMSLARLLAQQGDRDEARTMLSEIYGWFTEGFDTADLKDAKALLDELAG
jgi:predicted ATPase